jgi:hypothetical protein
MRRTVHQLEARRAGGSQAVQLAHCAAL